MIVKLLMVPVAVVLVLLCGAFFFRLARIAWENKRFLVLVPIGAAAILFAGPVMGFKLVVLVPVVASVLLSIYLLRRQRAVEK